MTALTSDRNTRARVGDTRVEGLATGALDRALNADAAAKGAPEWVHLIPNGFMEGLLWAQL